MWSEIYIPLIKSCELFQSLSKKINNLTKIIDFDTIKQKKYCHRLIVSSIKDLLLIIYSVDKGFEHINFVTVDFTLLLTFVQMQAKVFGISNSRFGHCSFTQLSKFYEPLYLFSAVFVSQYHFILSALRELNKKVDYFIQIDSLKIKLNYEFKYNDSENFLQWFHEKNILICKNSSSHIKENRVLSLFFEAKKGNIIQSFTTYQMAEKYQAVDSCLMVLP